MTAQPAPFLRAEPKPAKLPKTYKRYRASLSSSLADIHSELYRTPKEAKEDIVSRLLNIGALIVIEVAVVAKRETRYEEVGPVDILRTR